MNYNAHCRAGVAELVDAPDLGSGGETRAGSSPVARILSLSDGSMVPCFGVDEPWG